MTALALEQPGITPIPGTAVPAEPGDPIAAYHDDEERRRPR
jgi:hypothetical protein